MNMKTMHYTVYFLVVFFVFGLISCSSTPDSNADVVETTDTIAEEPVVEIVADEPEVQIISEEELEYTRSVAGLEGEISYDLFQADKNEILSIIDELDIIMQERDYQSWREYLTPSSISYWSNRMNLQVLSARLPGNEIVLRDLPQYFTNMFIPSRIGRDVTEIRYDSPSSVKAVQVEGDTDIIYYDFIKEDGKWLVLLQRL